MDFRRFLNLALAVVVTVGLAAAPLVAPATAAQPREGGMMDMSMSADMPCCPDQKAKDCGSCPFIALCMLTITLAAPEGASALVNRTFARRAFALPDDLLIDGLGEHPPDHPPRTIV